MEKAFTVLSVKGDVHVRVLKNGTIQVSGLRGAKPSTIANDSRRIWDMYKHYRSNDIVVRSGSGLCGVYNNYDPKNPLNRDYVESDTLHSTTVEELARNVFRFYPFLFDLEEQNRIINLLRYHDLGETVDNPDDGSKNKDEKFIEELETFINKTSSLNPIEQEDLIRDFVMFEHANEECWSEEDKRILQFAKLCDKADAPLGALLYELQGRPGSLLYKKKHYGGITEQDQKYADEIGEFSQAGVWTAHMIDTYLDYKNIDIFIRILVEACIDVRGHVFPWMYEFCKNRGIDKNILVLMC